MKLPRYECKRCGYKWIPRSEMMPVACANPKCRSPYWNKKRMSERGGSVVIDNNEDNQASESSATG